MSQFDALKGQVLLETVPESGNTGLRFSRATIGVYGPITGTPLHVLVGRFVTSVRYVEGQSLELEFVGQGQMRIDLTGSEAENFALVFPDGRMVVG